MRTKSDYSFFFFYISIHLNKEIDRYPWSLENDCIFSKVLINTLLALIDSFVNHLGCFQTCDFVPCCRMTVGCRGEEGQPAPTNLQKQREDIPLEPEAKSDTYVYYILHCLFSLIFLRNVSERMCVIWLFCYCCSKLPHHKKELKLFKCKGLKKYYCKVICVLVYSLHNPKSKLLITNCDDLNELSVTMIWRKLARLKLKIKAHYCFFLLLCFEKHEQELWSDCCFGLSLAHLKLCSQTAGSNRITACRDRIRGSQLPWWPLWLLQLRQRRTICPSSPRSRVKLIIVCCREAAAFVVIVT